MVNDQLNDTGLPLDELPTEIFRLIATLLANPLGQPGYYYKRKSIKSLFVVSKAVREKHFSVFMDMLWFQLNSKQAASIPLTRYRLPGWTLTKDRIVNMYRPTASVDLRPFHGLRRLQWLTKSPMSVAQLPDRLRHLTVVFWGAIKGEMDTTNLTQLTELKVVFTSHRDLCEVGAKINSPRLKQLDVHGIRVNQFGEMKQLQQVRIHKSKLHTTVYLHNSVEHIELSHCDFEVTDGGLVMLTRGDGKEVKDIRTIPGVLSQPFMHSPFSLNYNSSDGHKRTDTEEEVLRWWRTEVK